ncbi:MAG TPA: hypothetical protein VKB35_11850 [Ktedonobacteraceae bacterium]|nr:hypothetical protein [Ktedonobacteraceae bacterium]
MPSVRRPSTACNDQGCCGKEVGLFGRIAGSLSRTMLKAACSASSDRTSSTPAQARNMREINENLTILLGVASGQGGDIKVIPEKP